MADLKFFEERPTCYMLKADQKSELWDAYRVGRATSSVIGGFVNHCPFTKPGIDYYEKTVLRITPEKFSPQTLENLAYGNEAEPRIRDDYSKFLGKPLQEVSLAIWKEDERFAGSLDFEIIEEDGTSTEGGEIKAPQRGYRKLIEYCEARKKGYYSPGRSRCGGERSMEHIFRKHYDQMIANGIITNKKYMHYVVQDKETQTTYWDIIPVSQEYWLRELYTPVCKIFKREIEPLMRRHHINRLSVL